VRSRNSLHSDVEKEAEAATASFPLFYVDFGPVRLPQTQSARLMPSLRGAGARREDRASCLPAGGAILREGPPRREEARAALGTYNSRRRPKR